MLRGNEYLGQYGKITKILIPSHTYHSHSTSPQYSAYVTFESELEAAFVIIGLFEFSLGENVIRSSYGSTKYCLFYLRNKSCLNKDCLYQHLQASPHLTFNKNDSNNQLFQTHQKMARLTIIQNLQNYHDSHSVFPNQLSIYQSLLSLNYSENQDKQTNFLNDTSFSTP